MGKNLNILVGTPSYGYMKTNYVTSLLAMQDQFLKRRYEGIDQQSMFFGVIEGSVVAQSREDLVGFLLQKDFLTHILFIDEDMGFLPDALTLLVSRDKDIVGCNYRIKVPPCAFTARKNLDNEELITDATKTGIEECAWMGFGFCLIKKEVFEKVGSPRFLGGWNPTLKKYSTEDGPFFMKAKEAGIKAYVDHDASKLVYHNGNWAYSWDNHFPEELRYPYAERIRYKDKP